MDCPEDHDCSAAGGTVQPTPCPAGRTSPPGSPTGCSSGSTCDNENYLYNVTTRLCQRRTVACNLATQYEVANPLNATQERACRALTVCRTDVRLKDRSPIDGSPPGVALFHPLQEYILRLYSSFPA